MQTGRSHQLSTTQLGTIAETLVAAQLMLVSGGRFSTFTPQADDDGIDLLVLDKMTRRTLAIQVKARYAAIGRPGTIQFDTRIGTFRDAPGTWVLAVAVDPDSATLWRLWLIPSPELRSIAAQKRDYLVITPSPSPKSADRYTPWRCRDIGEVAARLSREADRTGGLS